MTVSFWEQLHRLKSCCSVSMARSHVGRALPTYGYFQVTVQVSLSTKLQMWSRYFFFSFKLCHLKMKSLGTELFSTWSITEFILGCKSKRRRWEDGGRALVFPVPSSSALEMSCTPWPRTHICHCSHRVAMCSLLGTWLLSLREAP